MAETPQCAYQVPVGNPTIMVLTVLYAHARQGDVDAYQRHQGPPPVALCDAGDVATFLAGGPGKPPGRLKKSQVYAHLGELKAAGAIRPATNGTGWELMPRVSDTMESGCQQRTTEVSSVRNSGIDQSGNPEWRVRESGTSPETRKKNSENSEKSVRESGNESGIPENLPSFNQFYRNKNETIRSAAAANNNSDRGIGKAGSARAISLIELLAKLHTPIEPIRRFRPGDPSHLRWAEDLLLVDIGPDDDVFAVAIARYEYVVSVCRDFATMAAVDWHGQETFWKPGMLSLIVGKKATMSPWEAVERNVEQWRREQRVREQSEQASTAQAGELERRAVEDRLADLAHLAQHGEPRFAQELRSAGQPVDTRDHAADLAAARAAVEAARGQGRAPTIAEVNAAIQAVPPKAVSGVEAVAGPLADQLPMPAILSRIAHPQAGTFAVDRRFEEAVQRGTQEKIMEFARSGRQPSVEEAKEIRQRVRDELSKRGARSKT